MGVAIWDCGCVFETINGNESCSEWLRLYMGLFAFYLNPYMENTRRACGRVFESIYESLHVRRRK